MFFVNEKQALPPDVRMRSLVGKINEASRAYYENDDPIISDAQWGKLYNELALLEKETGVRLPDSPTHRVGGQPLAVFLQHRHISRLCSVFCVVYVQCLNSKNMRILRTKVRELR